jgi:MFS family permease
MSTRFKQYHKKEVDMKKGLHYIILVFFLVVGTYLGMLSTTPPRIPEKIPPEDFSVQRELEHIKAIAQMPHPVGTEEHEIVRDYITKELKELGLNLEIQKTSTARRTEGGYRIYEVDNIVARLEGIDNSKAILLMAHYDSAPGAPGANDDGAGVAAILETLRALKAGSQIKNDIIVLISDAEELGLWGAKAFFDEHPWVNEIGVVLNLEARGSKGINLMFETGQNNKWLVNEFAEAARYSVGDSLLDAMYQRMPNDTDFSIFKDKGYQGMNFAYIDDWQTYHMPIDDLEHLDKRTLYHHGSPILALARHLGNMNLDAFPDGNAVYFNVFRSLMIIYSDKWVWIFTLFVGLLFVGTIVLGYWHKRLTVKGLILGFAGSGIFVGIGIALISLIWRLIGLRYGELLDRFTRDSDFRNVYLLGLAFLMIAVFSLLYALYSRWASIPDLSTGALLWWLIGMGVISVFIPGGSYLVTWPLLFAILALWEILLVRDAESFSTGRIFLLALLSIPVLLIMIPQFYTFSVAFSIGGAAFGILGVLLFLFIPYFMIVRKKDVWRFTGVIAFIGLVIILFGLFTLRVKDQPFLNEVTYHLNSDTDEGILAVRYLDDWTSQFIKESVKEELFKGLPFYGRDVFKENVQAAKIPSTEVKLLEESTDKGSRTLRLKITPTRKTFRTSAAVLSKTPVVLAEADGKPIDGNELKKKISIEHKDGYEFQLSVYGLREEGIELKLTFEGAGPVDIKILDQTFEIPNEINLPQPPKQIMVRSFAYVTKSFTY